MPQQSASNESRPSPAPTRGPRVALRIRPKLLIATCLPVIAAVALLWLLIRGQLSAALQLQADQLGETLAAQTADSVTELVLANDQLSLNVVLNQLARGEGIASVTVFNVDNQVIASAGTAPAPGSAPLNTAYTAPVALQDAIAGSVRLTLDPGALSAPLSRTAGYFGAALGLGVFLALAGALLLGRNLAAPLMELLALLRRPGERELSADPGREDEVAWVRRAGAALAAEFRALKESLRPPAAEGGPEGLRLQASALCLRVANIDTAMELLHPVTLSRLLEEYHFYFQQAARLQGGYLQGFSGESVMAVFNSRDCAEPAQSAARCARLFLMLMRQINAAHRAQGSPVLEYCLGLDSGEVFLAPSGGGRRRRETALGKVPARARRLCAAATAGEVLLSGNALAQCGASCASALPQENGSGDAETARREIQGGADKPPFMAYSLPDASGGEAGILDRQRQQILPDRNEAAPKAGPSSITHDDSAKQ